MPIRFARRGELMPSGIGIPPYKWTTPMQVKELDNATPPQ